MHRKLIYVMPNRIIPDHFCHSHEQPGNIEVGVISDNYFCR